jgi:hypothetical protein
MQSFNFGLMLPFEVFSLVTNVSTLTYIFRNFDVRGQCY